ncbi:MAG TPA: hypothetical protein VLI05_02485 [Candidatus Saccharimonadia bacterium]|nr:hypothetical protein [Candidatus Saccharimonadia bacterium]
MRQRWLTGLLIVLVLGTASATVVVNQRLLAATAPNICANRPNAPVHHQVTLQLNQASPG